jgi:uncharacterized phage protein (TIGR02220 family)
MKIQLLMNAGSWLPYNRELAVVFGADVAILFSELCHLSEQFGSEKNDGWFFAPSARLAELTGMKRGPLERCLSTLCEADLLLIDAKGIHNTRHFKLEQSPSAISAICAAFSAAPAQTPAAPKKTAPRAKQTANTAKETPNHTEQPLEMVQPVGKADQLPAEKPKKPKANTGEIEAAAVRLIEHFNAVAGTAFRTTGKANIECFGRVLKAKEGTEEEIRMVIELKTMQWANKPEMREYLKPETLCRPSHFSKYLEEAYAAKNQQASGQRAPSFVAAQDSNLTIELPNGQRFGDYFDRKDQRKVDMIKAQMIAHPGIEKFLPPQLAFKQYLASINETELQHHLKEARREWRYANYTPPNPNQLPF